MVQILAEQSQNVYENKEHDFFGLCKRRDYLPESNPDSSQTCACWAKGSERGQAEQGGPTVTNSRLKPLRLFGRSLTRSRSVVAPAQGLEFFQSARPVLLEQARKRAVRQELAARLADGAVIGLVIGVADALHLGAAARARLAVAALMPGLRFPSPAGPDLDNVSCAGPS